MTKVIHLMPYDGIGGVEMAAKSALDYDTPNIQLALQYIFPNVSSRDQRQETFNPFSFLTAAWKIIKAKPDILIVSLWRASIVGILVKICVPQLKLVTFIHNSKDAHIGDKFFTRLSAKLSTAVFYDSDSSRQQRFSVPIDKPGAIISFLTKRVSASDKTNDTALPLSFIFWGRLNPQKNIPRALKLFSAIHNNAPHATFDIIGPDGGEIEKLRQMTEQLHLQDAVRFHGALEWTQIAKIACNKQFYLQTSHYEGMAMSVTEAMQLGLVPVVTPVGEIARYCNADNALILTPKEDRTEDLKMADTILQLSQDPHHYQKLRQNSQSYWATSRIYCEDLFDQLSLLTGPSA